MQNKTGLLERLEKDVVLCAEGYLFEMERRGYLKAGPFVPDVVLEHPEAVKELHREFLRAGSEVMVAFTYYAHREKMKAIDKEDMVEQLNRQAIRLANEVAAEGDALVAGNLSNTWKYNEKEPEISEKTVRPMFEEQIEWALDEGIDFIIGETFSHVGEALIALKAIKENKLPSVINYAPTYEKTVDGYGWDEACKILQDNGADVVGLNCTRGPNTMYEFLSQIREKVTCHMAAIPVPYRTTPQQPFFQALKEPGSSCAFPLSLDPFVHTRSEVAEFAIRAKEMGINFIGLCCGAAPHHIREMAEALGRTVPASAYSADLSLHPYLGKGKIFCNLEE